MHLIYDKFVVNREFLTKDGKAEYQRYWDKYKQQQPQTRESLLLNGMVLLLFCASAMTNDIANAKIRQLAPSVQQMGITMVREQFAYGDLSKTKAWFASIVCPSMSLVSRIAYGITDLIVNPDQMMPETMFLDKERIELSHMVFMIIVKCSIVYHKSPNDTVSQITGTLDQSYDFLSDPSPPQLKVLLEPDNPCFILLRLRLANILRDKLLRIVKPRCTVFPRGLPTRLVDMEEHFFKMVKLMLKVHMSVHEPVYASLVLA